MPRLVAVDPSPIATLSDPIPAEKVISGAPMTGTRPALESEKKGFYTGVWEASVGKWRISCTEDELCVILEGHVRLTDADGESREYKQGDAFVIASGFEGTWETIERVRKIYAIAL